MTPTDKDLIDFAVAEQFILFCDTDEFVQIARAVLAKWGTPTPAGEPVGHLRMGPKEEFAATKRAEELDINVWHAVFTAPPVREPLSDEQIGALSCRDGLTNVEVPVIAWLVREVEHMHGITKGEPT
ncbi:hypothetical protein [Acidovorax sp. BL-A-41-H1]|uniref:hypothetical protein n=1 Tax=Acidovorax sp. BL-A-41-H1 TaxID=3421102 RepID=UPI003F7A7F49